MSSPPGSGHWLEPGEPVTLDNCAREPIHLPGRVQAHGALVVVDVRAAASPVVQLSLNAPAILGLEGVAQEWLGRPLADLVGADAAQALGSLPVTGPPSTRPTELALASGRQLVVQCFSPAAGLLGVDLEASPLSASGGVEVATQAALAAGELVRACTPLEVAETAARLLRDITGFSRVWAYRFEPDGHGVIVAEQRPEGLAPFLGLHFPEGDIPAQARALYLTSGVRLIGDSEADDVPLVPEVNPVTGERLDLSGSDLRGVSPMHVRYLRNMGVRTSMSVPLVVDGQLWGLLSAHEYDRQRAVPMQVRSQCETLGKLTSMQLAASQRLQDAQDHATIERQLRDLVAHLGSASSVAQGLAGMPGALLDVCGGQGVSVHLGDDHVEVGQVPDAVELEQLIDVLEREPDDVIVSECVAALDPSLADLAPVAAGVLAVCLSRRHRNWLIWFRGEQLEEVTWANRDQGLVRRDPGGALELGERESFERWAERIQGRSRPWNSAQIRAAHEITSAVGAFALHQAEQLRARTAELMRANEELDAFAYSAAHDLREPVRGIAMRSELLLLDSYERLTADERESLQVVLRLTGHMGGLVDTLLEYAKLDYAAHQPQRLELSQVVADVRELIGRPAAEARITSDDVTVDADRTSLRQVLYNLVWNAVKYSPHGAEVHVGTAPFSRVPGAAQRIHVAENSEDDPDVFFVRDHGIGIDPQHHETIFGLFRRLHSSDEYGGGSGAGLALCRRIVQRTGGAIWVESTLGAGATFYFTLPAPAAA